MLTLASFYSYGGAYAEYIAVNAHMLLHKPKHLSWEQAAGVPEVRAILAFCSDIKERADVLLDLDDSHPGYVFSRWL
jgi:NADPH:quinone reductase-like Zn-dependent oxidoreductase